MTLSTGTGALGAGTLAPAASPNAASPAVGAPFLEEVADGVHAFVQPPGGWCLNNAGLVTGRPGGEGPPVLIDTAATESRARLLRREVERVAPDGPGIVVNTHFHGDHTFGNSQFTPRAVVVAHEGTRTDSAEAGLGLCGLWPDVEWGEIPLTLPTLTFRDGLTLRAGGLRVELLHLGPAHTADDTVAWVPERGVLFTGDLVWSGVTPFVLMGSVTGSLRALERMRALAPRVVVPGHGPVGGPELLDATEAYLRWLLRIARESVRDGLPPLEAARRADLGGFAGLLDPERLVGNLHRARAELEGLPPGTRMDVAGPFGEMVAYHGGLPDCHA
ncbi:MBL fold metallo-hydrolase [Streptomyces radiopugnans]|uniref:Cyclase n=1 Tax=Streptomyces radiopugnans TaxID=403935 RepID=A0A1H9CVE4_9ACTN|nr:MBL fold metallo-hydrolase [Streptomyces radiopugnans]SEQ05144.1 cyclase [Streptomyces radiopugnans]